MEVCGPAYIQDAQLRVHLGKMQKNKKNNNTKKQHTVVTSTTFCSRTEGIVGRINSNPNI